MCTGEDEEEGRDMEGRAPRVILGGTGGNNPPASVRDRLRLGLVLPTWPSLRRSSGVGVSSEVSPSNTVKQMDSWDSLLGGGGATSGVGQKWMGIVRRRLNTVLGLGTGFTTTLLTSEFVNMAARFGVELFRGLTD